MFGSLIVATLLLVAVGPGPAVETTTLKIDGVPARLSLPLPTGSNCIVTATVIDGSARRVWLATHRDSSVQIALAGVDANQYRINLAEKEVGTVLSALAAGEFRFFAELAEGQVIASVPVSYTPGGEAAPAPEFHVFAGKKGQLDRIVSHNGVYFTSRRSWLEIGTDVIEVRSDHPRDWTVQARVGEARWPFVRSGDRRSSLLELDPTRRAILQETGKIDLLVGSPRVQITFQVPPAKLDFSGPFRTVRVEQRGYLRLAESRGYLILTTGDITGGAMRFDLRGGDQAPFIGHRTMRQGDSATFELEDEGYTVILRRLQNNLLGPDFATIDIWRGQKSDGAQIDACLQTLARAEVTFIRGEAEYTGIEAEKHLREKLANVTAETISWDEFVNDIASKSSTTGKPYRVRTKDGKSLDAAQWLREQGRRSGG